MNSKTLNDHLNWRYATKKIDPAKFVPQDKVDAIIEAVRMPRHLVVQSRLNCSL